MNAIRHLRFKHLFPYLEKIVGSHTSDKRIFLWDICNEPFNTASSPEIRNIILKWLKEICLICKNLGAEIPLCTGTIPNIDTVKLVEPVSDVITIHPYGAWNAWVKDKKDFEGFLDEAVSFANQSKKPLLASECCWGSLDDKERGEEVACELSELKGRGIGWLAHILHHSLVADGHRPEFGPVHTAGNMSFIETDGSLRPYHDVFNQF